MPNPVPILSVIIVAYKSRTEIEACLASIPRRIDDRAVEVAVVDNYPADGTSTFVRENFAHVRVIDPPGNVGFGKANNLGFAATTGECVLFLNPDTVCNETALTALVNRAQTEDNLGVISPRLVQADGSMDLACRRSLPTAWDGFCRASGLAARWSRTKWFAGYNLTHLPEDETYDVGAINGAFMLGRRAVFNQVAAPTRHAVFDEAFFMYGDDLDLCARIGRAGYRVVYDGRYDTVHLKGQSVARDYDAMSTAIFDANRDVYLKHFAPHVFARWKWQLMFGLWKRVALWRARRRGHQRVRPV
ncbi:glycosyltransferase family 2 protein [Synoicihabitans lomoniglobus]|uniref:Glycosyltransferase family 2 protein n=1 Tax=Synoicihabitans lomoniglobus TaxID=2909285 RepID=A0AAF0I5Z5_9BACT|nr:glycosyltransferase family 2 protein [Opitutaceae bacterium LMO-M01]WED67275.1 glycosyltransferase family 2 protein [Opitutaceae bacterium LMO-M01]